MFSRLNSRPNWVHCNTTNNSFSDQSASKQPFIIFKNQGQASINIRVSQRICRIGNISKVILLVLCQKIDGAGI